MATGPRTPEVWDGGHPVTVTGWGTLGGTSNWSRNCSPDTGWYTLIERDIISVACDELGRWGVVTGLKLSACYSILLLNYFV